MKTENATFEGGTYNSKCSHFPDKMIGSVLCTGYSDLKIPKCNYCVSFKMENTYYLPIMRETIPIVSKVVCSFQEKQLSLF